MSDHSEPVIIQGGMGAAVSSWRLARAVASQGQMGVVSGTAMDVVLARRLQDGDPGGHLRRAMDEFPFPEITTRILERYYISGGRAPDAPYKPCPMSSANPSQTSVELTVVANFVEVYLAKEGHDGLVGINYLEKIQLPTLPSIYGAMLAGVDYVLMGAGIPRAIPGALDKLCQGEAVELQLNVVGAERGDRFVTRFDPKSLASGDIPWLHRPKFVAIIASSTLATMLARKSSGRVDGFVVEGPKAGGHNAPPRGTMELDDRGEPIYGTRDVPNLDDIAALGLPFWLAGSYGTPDGISQALRHGATGVQVGTAFAFCRESGLRDDIKKRVLDLSRTGTTHVRTDPVASPAGYPFKVLDFAGSISEEGQYLQRERVCDLGYLRHAYKRPDGSLGMRCPAEEIDAFVRKGGDEAETRGRKCVCNGLLANVGLAQVRKESGSELPLITCGDDVRLVADFLPTPDATSYSANDVVARLLSRVGEETGQKTDTPDTAPPQAEPLATLA